MITWNDLTTEEQDMVAEMATRDRISDPDCDWSQDMYDGLVAKGVIINSDDEYTFTPAGRALLPAGEAVDVPSPSEAESDDAVFVELVKLYKAYKSNPRDAHVRLAYFEALADARLTDFYKVLDDKKSLQADLAAALARAQAAEGEVRRLRGEIDTAAKLIKNECNASLIGWGGIHLNGLPHNLQGYARIFDAINQLTLNKKLK